ncbi:MAG: S41 family peptidase [Alphaproteobacteria bacterium]|nr:S41 family peptidase [Alphaproteobacteria bacterium]
MRILLSLLLLSSFVLSPAAFAQEGRTAGTVSKKEEPSLDDTYRQLSLFGDVFERVRAQYVEPVTDEKLVEYAIQGMLGSLDPHSSYLTADDFQDMQVQTKGEFGGLGIEVTMENGFVKVVSPIDDTPAFKAGILAGDFITHLDNEPVMGLTLSEAVDKMRGKVGEPITITVVREGAEEPMDIEIIRNIIKIQSVRSRIEQGDIGYIRITTFNQNTTPGLEKAIKEIKAEAGDKLKGYVLDLRNNPGGLLDQAISVSDTFLDKGEIVSTRGRNESDTKRDNATPGDLTDGKPMIVLINGGSASAAEIVAGALQDHRRGILLGTQSFGKGSVQTIIPLPGHGAMRLTTARYYTPSGRSIQAEGIEPDIVVEPAKVEQLASFKRVREGDLRGALNNDSKVTAKLKALTEKAKENESATEEEKQPANDNQKTPTTKGDDEATDYQLDRAIDLLRGVIMYGDRIQQVKK